MFELFRGKIAHVKINSTAPTWKIILQRLFLNNLNYRKRTVLLKYLEIAKYFKVTKKF